MELRRESVEEVVVVVVELRRNVRGEREKEVVVAAIFSGDREGGREERERAVVCRRQDK